MHHRSANWVWLGLALLIMECSAVAQTFSTSSSGVMYTMGDGGVFYVSGNPITTANNFSGLNNNGTAFNLDKTRTIKQREPRPQTNSLGGSKR